jgi:hypothetical protein
MWVLTNTDMGAPSLTRLCVKGGILQIHPRRHKPSSAKSKYFPFGYA